MPKPNISFAKLVSPPSSTAWAQTYHAGNVYAVVSVEERTKDQDPEHALPSVLVTGKDIINNLEAEYFAIAEKNLHTIKEAVQNACKDIPETTTATVLFGVLHEDTLYIFLYGNGKVLIKRNEKFGILLQSDGKTKDVLAASGKLAPGDIITLATHGFTTIIPQKELLEHLIHPVTELGEHLNPLLDDEKYAGSAAIVFAFEGSKEQLMSARPTMVTQTVEEVDTSPQKNKAELTHASHQEAGSLKEEPKMDLDAEPQIEEDTESEIEKPRFHLSLPQIKLSRRRLLFLGISVLLVILLIGSIGFNKGKQQNTQDLTEFNSEFPAAKQQYDEGQSLLSLNKSLALDDFQKAKTALEDLHAKLQPNSPQEVQVEDLLNSVNQQLQGASNALETTLTLVDASASKLLAAEIANATNRYFAEDDNGAVYTIDANGITNTSDTKHTLVTNQKDWTTIGGFGTYLGNFYVLDTSSPQVLKFAKTASDYSKTNYFSSAPDLSKAVSLTIDGDIWILSSSGTIQEFTKGKPDQFSVQGLQKPLQNPTKVFTTADQDNLYVLDNGNSRVVAIKKADGTITAEYDATNLKNAKDIDVDEKNKKIFALISGKVYEIDMK